MAEYEIPQYTLGDSGDDERKVAKREKKVIAPPPKPTAIGKEREITVEVPQTLDGKLKSVSRLLDEQSKMHRKLSLIEEKLIEMAEKDIEDDISKKLATAEKLKKVDRMSVVEEMGRSGVAELSDNPNELIELYRITQEKLMADRKKMAEVREKLHRIVREESTHEEDSLKNLLKTLTVTRKRLDVVEKITALEGGGIEESEKLISLLKKRKDELEAEIEEEMRIREQEAIEKQRQLEELEKQKQLAQLTKVEEKKEEEPKGFLQKLLSKFKKKKPRVVKIIACPKCRGKIEITSQKRPIKIKCPACGAEGTLKK